MQKNDVYVLFVCFWTSNKKYNHELRRYLHIIKYSKDHMC